MDNINHPAHYTKYKTEVIDITRYLPFCLGNVVKYVLRAPYKGGVEDCDKALQYIQWCSFTPIQGTMREMTKLYENIYALRAEMREDNFIEAWQRCFLAGLVIVLDGGFYENIIDPIKQLRQLLEEKAE